MLNKYFRTQFIFAFLVSSAPFIAFAAGGGGIINCANDPCKLSDVLPVIKSMNRYIVGTLIPPVAVIAFIYAGFTMVMGVGNPGEVKKAQDIMYYAVYGMIVAFAAYLIINFIVDGLAGGTVDVKVNEYLKE